MTTESPEIVSIVRSRYAAAAVSAEAGEKGTCCGTSGCCSADPITSDLYDALHAEEVPSLALMASLGCGNPTALADLHEGEVVLDLGSGGGIDVLLSARRVGASGHAYGLDMTDEMLSIARRNADASGLKNVSFLKGQIESIPLPDASIDVIISNCVINLSGDKSQVLREAFRVLKPGGRFAVSDVVTRGELPSVVRDSMGLWTGCVAGALDSEEFVDKLHAAGFAEASVEPTRVYTEADAHTLLADVGLDADALAPLVEGKVMAAFVRATKPREGVA